MSANWSLHGRFLYFHLSAASGVFEQNNLAVDVLDIAPGTLNRWLTGRARVTPKNLGKIAKKIAELVDNASTNSFSFEGFYNSFGYLERSNGLGYLVDEPIPEMAAAFLSKSRLPTKRGASLHKTVKPQFTPRGLPPEFVRRKSKLREIKAEILLGEGPRNVALTTMLHGFGGFGKTTLAKDVYNDPDIREVFSDGVFWVQCKKDLSLKPEFLVASLLSELDPKASVPDRTSARRELINSVTGKRALLIVDDVWYNAHAEPFRDLPQGCAVLMTTRMKHLALPGMSKIHVDEMEPEEALDVLKSNLERDGKPMEFSPSDVRILERIAKRLGYWAQLLGLANGRLYRRCGKGSSLADAATDFLSLLEKRGIVVADHRDTTGKAAEARARAMRLCIDASLEMLTGVEREYFLSLGILPKDTDIPADVITDYWHETGKLEADESRDLIETFADMSLLQFWSGEKELVGLHDNIIDYLNRRLSENAKRNAHQAMVVSLANHCPGGWATLLLDHTYGWTHLLTHLEGAEGQDQADDCRTDFHWLKAKLHAVGAQELYRSFFPVPLCRNVAKIGQAIALSMPVISIHSEAFAHQLYGRMGYEDAPRLTALTESAHKDSDFYPKPLRPHLPPLGAEVMRFTGHDDGVHSAVFSTDSKHVLTASEDRTARMWETQNGSEVRCFEGHWGPVLSAVFSPSDRHVLTASSDQTARIWDTWSGAEIQCFRGHSGPIRNATFSNDGLHILTASDDRTARIWDSQTGSEIVCFDGHRAEVLSAVFSSDNQKILTASDDQSVKIWDTKNGAEIHHFERIGSWIQSATFSSDLRYVLAASGDNKARIWDAQSGSEVRSFHGHRSKVWSAVFCGDDKSVLTTSSDRTARIWDAQSGSELRRFVGHSSWVWNGVFAADGRHVLTASSDGTARIWDSQIAEQNYGFDGHVAEIQSAVFSPDSRLVLTASWDRTALLWDAFSGAKVRGFKGHWGPIQSAVFSPDGRQVLTASWDNTARIWDASNGLEDLCVAEHKAAVLSAVFSTDGEQVLTASSDGTARIWDAFCVRERRCFAGHKSWVQSAAFSPDCGRVLTASDDQTVRIWDVQSGSEILCFNEHKAEVLSATFSFDGKKVLSASRDGSVKVWDAHSGGEIVCFERNKAEMQSAVFSLDGRHVLSASTDKTVQIWCIESARLCKLLHLDFVPTSIDVTEGRFVVGDSAGKFHVFAF